MSRSAQEARDAQARLAAATAKLEDLFADQFGRGTVDRQALAGAIDEVLRAFPELARATVKEHIDQVIAAGQQLAAQMSAEERAAVADPPEQLTGTDDAAIEGWGWDHSRGFGGFGAFGFPGMFRFGHSFRDFDDRFRGHFHERGFRGFDCDWDDPSCRLGGSGWFW